MAYLSLSLLGPFQAWTANGALQSFRTSKERALLAYLSVENSRPHLRENLASMFWPDRSESTARNNLRQGLYGIRQAIGAAGFDAIFSVSADEVRFNLTEEVWLDLSAFEVHLKSAQLHSHNPERPCAYCLQHMRDAVDIYRSDFLADLQLEKSPAFDQWLWLRRGQYFRMQLRSLEVLSMEYEQAGEYAQAVEFAQRLVLMNDRNEEVCRRLMKLLVKTGRFSAALEQFELFRQRLERSGTHLSSETLTLGEQIRTGRLDAELLPHREIPHNLPEQLTPFIGREIELRQMATCFESPGCRLLTICGPGGVGKTRLAIYGAQASLHTFPDGVFFVSLNLASTQEQMTEFISNAVGLVAGGQQESFTALQNYLRDRHLLLILDNMEHLLEYKDLLLSLLQMAPFVKVMVTSRERLNYQTETVIDLQGLSFPGKDAPEITGRDQQAGSAQQYAAVRLFLERASRVGPDLFWTEPESGPSSLHSAGALASMESVVRICQIVEGLPLGIELAASWARDYTFEEIASEVQRSYSFLQATFTDLPERNRSLRASFEHSWDLLSESEQEVFCKLAVFSGNFSTAAAQAVAGAALPWLVRLENKSLVRKVASGRYDLHPLLRQFASQKLRQYSRRIDSLALQQHAQFFCTCLREYEPGLRGGRQAETLCDIEADLENYRAAWQWAVTQCDANLLGQAAFSLFFYMDTRGRWREAEEEFARAVKSLKENRPNLVEKRLLASLMAYQGWFCTRLTCYEQAELLLNGSIDLLSDLPNDQAYTFAHFALGFLMIWKGNFRASYQYLSTCLASAQQANDRWSTAWAREILAEMAFESGSPGFHEEQFQDILSVFSQLGELRGISRVLNYLGNIAMTNGHYDRSRSYFEKLLSSAEKVGDVWGSAGGYSKLGRLAVISGDFERAWALHQRALELLEKTGDVRRTAYTLSELGEVAASLNRTAEAEKKFHQALGITVRTRNLTLASEILTGIAAALLRRGKAQQAADLLELVLTGKTLDPLTVNRAEQLLQALPVEFMHKPPQIPGQQDNSDLIWETVEVFFEKAVGLYEGNR